MISLELRVDPSHDLHPTQKGYVNTQYGKVRVKFVVKKLRQSCTRSACGYRANEHGRLTSHPYPTKRADTAFRSAFAQFFASELIALAGSGSGAVQRELKRLTSSGLILKTVGMIEPVRQALQPIRERIKLALVYGSVAKGTETSGSDIDLLIVAKDLALETVYSVLMPAEESVSRTINPTLYTTEEFDRRRKAGNSFLVRVLDGEHVVLIGQIDDSA